MRISRQKAGRWHQPTPIGATISIARRHRERAAARNVLLTSRIGQTPLGALALAICRLLRPLRIRRRFHVR